MFDIVPSFSTREGDLRLFCLCLIEMMSSKMVPLYDRSTLYTDDALCRKRKNENRNVVHTV